jgi:hypothetical protein
VNDRAGGLTHQEAWELLPWLVNATLEPAERAAVEAHVVACRECRDEAERCRSVAQLVGKAIVAPSPHPAQLSRLLRRIDEVEGARAHRGVVALLGRTPMTVRWALVAQAAALFLLVSVVFWPARPRQASGASPAIQATQPSQSSQPTYRTLGDPPPVAAAAHRVRVVFRPTATEAEIRRLLLEVRSELVGGPSALGAYTIAVPATGSGAEALALVLEHLRADPRVRFAEPVAGGGADG